MIKQAKTHHTHPPGAESPVSEQAEAPNPELQKTTMEMTRAMAVPPNGSLTPDPAIRENALRRLQALRTKRPGILEVLKRHIFEFRIPVYQTVFGMAVLFAVFFVTDRAFLSNKAQDLQLINPTPTAGPLVDTSRTAARADTQQVAKNALLQHIGIIDTFLTGSARDTL